MIKTDKDHILDLQAAIRHKNKELVELRREIARLGGIQPPHCESSNEQR